MKFIRNLKDITKDDVKIAGGKGASLGEMKRAGLPVPKGFVILAPAYEEFLKEGRMPEDVATEIKTAFANEGFRKSIIRVAVRSSATAEDSKNAAWAGQLETYLNTTEKKLLKNVQRCWESLSSQRAEAYRKEQGISKKKISVAVIVQEMVPSEIAGVAFSVHPVTEDRNQILIEAVRGQGEKLVSGQVTPERFIFAKDTRALAEASARGKTLSEKQITELTEFVVKIEKHFGFPVDIEWAYAKKKFWILQSRSITTLQKSKKKNQSQLPVITSAEFWAREKSMPLFWLTDSKHDLGSYSLFLYKKDMCHCFYVNGSEREEAERGFKFFTTKKNRQNYLKLAARVAEDAEQTTKEFEKYNVKKVTDKELRDTFDRVIAMLEEFISVYTETEAFRMKKFEETKIAYPEFEEFGKMRLRLRHDSKKLFFVFIGQLLGEVARRNKTSLTRELFFYTLDELNDLIHKKRKPPAKIIAKRTKGFAVLRKGKEMDFFLKHDADILWEQVKDLTMPKNKKDIIGATAFPGKVVGRVRVVFQRKGSNVGDYGVKKGEILVTDMTKPDMVLACKKAKAIVTDEGGIVCHAAILSREYKKPCIVGTKIATQVLKTGDVVEVDAEKGTVHVIGKARH